MCMFIICSDCDGAQYDVVSLAVWVCGSYIVQDLCVFISSQEAFAVQPHTVVIL